MITIYHNNRCSKSRGALQILQEQSIPHTIRPYLEEPFSKKELVALLKKLGIKASALVRRSETYYKEHLSGSDFSEQQWIDELLAHPELIERPIVVNGNKAVVARPPERLFDIL